MAAIGFKALAFPDMGIPEKLREYLADQGWSERELARRLHVSAMSVNRWVAGSRSLRVADLLALARLSRRPVQYWIDDDVSSVQELPSGYSLEAISADEREILEMARAWGVSKAAALQALAIASKLGGEVRPSDGKLA
jgi:transcriptional regulator with XRE-family HTH domain